MTDVVATLIWDGDRFLICQRPAHKARGLLWEFVGGKVEPGETHQEALIRECQEELAITVRPGHIFMELTHEYPDLTVQLTLYHAVISEGVPQMLEHHDIRWIQTGEIDDFDFCPADVEILSRLKQVTGFLQTQLLSSSDTSYQAFHSKLMPTVSPEKILGVRMPALRKIAAEFSASCDTATFLHQLPHKFYEEDNLHGILISQMTDFSEAISALDAFLPYVDNWATCDLIVPKVFTGNQIQLLPHIRRWLSNRHSYTVRFSLGMLMRFYLEAPFTTTAMELAASVHHEDYYVQMMVAWFFATALSKHFDTASAYLKEGKLPVWIHNKTIQKAIESNRISCSEKALLKTWKIKSEKR